MAVWPTTTSASGMWKPNQVRRARRGDAWPGEYIDTFDFDLADVTYDGIVATYSGTYNKITISKDGLYLYLTAYGSSTFTRRWTMESPWAFPDLSTTAYDYSDLSPRSYGIATTINEDGTKFYYCYPGTPSGDALYEYTLATPYDTRTNGGATTEGLAGNSVTCSNFSKDGKFVFYGNSTGQNILRLTLTTGFSLATASVDAGSTSSLGFTPTMIDCNRNATVIYYVNASTYELRKIVDPEGLASTYSNQLDQWTDSGQTADLGALTGGIFANALQSFEIKPDGTKFWVVDATGPNIYQFSTGL